MKALILILLFHFANAEDKREECPALDGDIVLSQETQYYCEKKDQVVMPGTRIFTQGYDLRIIVLKELKILPKSGLKIFSFKRPAPQSHAAGKIFISAGKVSGSLEIYNRGASEKDLSGSVALEYGVRDKSYTQHIEVAPGTGTSLIVNGYEVPLETAVTATSNQPAAAETAAAPSEKRVVAKKPKPRIYREQREARERGWGWGWGWGPPPGRQGSLW